MDPRFFNPWKDVRITKNRLPHWQQPGATYFITFRLADALPHHLRQTHEIEKEAWLKHHPKPWNAKTEAEYHARFSGAIERWLDAGHGSCALREHQSSELVANALAYFDGDRYLHHTWVVMPNHVHAVVSLDSTWTLEKILHSWKSYTAHEIQNRIPGHNIPRPFWQPDYFDRMIRDRNHFENCVRYVRRNPTKANLREGEYRLFESELAKEIT